MNTSVKTGLICAAGAVAIGAAATGIITAVRVAKKKKAINYKEKIEAYKEAEKTNTVTEEIKAEAEEAKAEVKKVIKKEIVENAIGLVAAAAFGFGLGFAGRCMYENGYNNGRCEGIAFHGGILDAALESGALNTNELDPGYFTELSKSCIEGYTEGVGCRLASNWKDIVDEISNRAKESMNAAMAASKEVIA